MSSIVDKRLIFSSGDHIGLQMHDFDTGKELGIFNPGDNWTRLFRSAFITPNQVVSGGDRGIFLFDIEKQKISKKIENTGFSDPHGFDVISSEGKHIILIGNFDGNISAYDLETSERIYNSLTFSSEARDILKCHHNKRLFCAAGRNSLQIHDLEKKKKVMGSIFCFTEGYIVGLTESKKHSLYAAGFHYERRVVFADHRTLQCVGKSKERSNSERTWCLESMEEKNVILVGVENGGVNVYDVRKFDDIAYSFKVFDKKINKILKIGDGELFCFSGLGKRVKVFSEDEKKMEKEFIIKRKEPSLYGGDTYMSTWGLCTNFNFSFGHRNLELSKKDNEERVEYICEEYLDDKKYSRKIELRNTTIYTFTILL